MTHLADLPAQLGRFVIVGATTAVVYLTAVVFLVEAGGLAPWLAAVGSYFAAMLINYTGHYFFTYRTDTHHARTMLRYGATNAVLLVGNAGATYLAVNAFGLDYRVVQMVLLSLVAGIVFIAQRRWVFSRDSATTAHGDCTDAFKSGH